MAITMTFTPSPGFGNRFIDKRDQFVIKQQDGQNHLQQVFFPEMTIFISQLNFEAGVVNSKAFSASLSANVATEAKDEAVVAKNAAEQSYQNTKTLLEGVDITGTGGYTIEAIDEQNEEQELMEFLNFKI